MKQTTNQKGILMKITTKYIPTLGVLSGVLLLSLSQALGQTLPLEIRQMNLLDLDLDIMVEQPQKY